ncbi:endonuclease dU [Rhodothermus profundi]|uniref:Uncharacterized protein n=1 Tax=Rhodothermus profundi TaxID=633813 RepID=A0A1M6V6L6_9BACT|nr:DUF99 family protein [Rhodothermus profundi]SHK77065.1 hypothetical protein SAMN04488087_1918 [Rhodothermus profundi]
MTARRPHVLGIDDAPFERERDKVVPIVGVMMEGATLVEGVAITRFPIDGAGATDFLAGWIQTLRWRPSLQAVVLGGITLAGLGVVDLVALSEQLALPVLAVTRRDTAGSELADALQAAGLEDRLAILERTPPAEPMGKGLYVAWAGTDAFEARQLVQAMLHKARLPEPLRIAHLIGAALVRGQSRGRV